MTKEEILKKKVSAISLGCDKNRVDLEKILYSLKKEGFEIVANPEEANIVVVNTCAFILPAKQEAIENIIEMESLKRRGQIEKVIVTGCFPERNFNDLQQNFPDVDLFVRVKDNYKIPSLIKQLYGVEDTAKEYSGRVLTTTGSYAYLKIADGCNNSCAYCTIPRIRGRYKSVPIKELVDEAKDLIKIGVKEIILVAQDTTRYGEDLYKKNQLIELCQQLVKIRDLKWLRIHYIYPEMVTDELLEFIAKEEKVCKYIDIPLQHIDENILKSMRRRLSEEDTRELIIKIKDKYPEIAIRTTFIVGYPGETRKQFKKLCNFLTEAEFDFAGFFPYYREENTIAYFMKHQKSKRTKCLRLKKVQEIQGKQAYKKMTDKVGQIVRVLVDDFNCDNGNYIGHSEWLSPNVDFPIEIDCEAQIGEMIDIELKDFDGNKFIGGKK